MCSVYMKCSCTKITTHCILMCNIIFYNLALFNTNLSSILKFNTQIMF